MEQYNYSVIIPHYNSPTLLQRCLDSIPDREDIQVIIVDDCSDPKKVNYEKLPGRERRFTEIYKTTIGGSAGRARNVGLEQAKGKWLLFADADDFYTGQAWDLFEKHYESSADIIYFGITSVDSDTQKPTDRYKTYDKFVQTYASNKTEINANWLRYRHDVPWGKMIRQSLIKENKIVFGETKYCNDTLFSCNCALKANSIDVEPNVAYCVTDTQNSLTKQVSPEALQTRFGVICHKNMLLKKYGLEQYQMPILFYLRQAYQISIPFFCKMVIMGTKYNCSWLREIKRWILRTPTK